MMSSWLARFLVAPLAASLLLAAPATRADEPASDDKGGATRVITVDSSANRTSIEKMSSTQDQRAFSIALLTYDQPT